MMIMKQANKQRAPVHKIGYTKFSQEGFTIIESLVAIIVVSILLAAIAPVLVLSVATRVQSRRVELGTQAARTYIDGVKAQKILAPAPPSTNTALKDFNAPAPSANINCDANSYCHNTNGTTSATPTNLYCVDFDGLPAGTPKCESTSNIDIVVQAFRPNNNNPATGYALGLRVYRADAFRTNSTLVKSTSTSNKTQATFTGGAGRRAAPLVEMTSDINDIIPKYTDLCDRLRTSVNDCKD